MKTNAQTLHTHVESKKKAAKNSFSVWFYNKFSHDKKQLLRNEPNDTKTKVKVEDMPSSTGKEGSRPPRKTEMLQATASSLLDSAVQQQSYLRAQLTEMKRHSQEMLSKAATTQVNACTTEEMACIESAENKTEELIENPLKDETDSKSNQDVHVDSKTTDNQMCHDAVCRETTIDTQPQEQLSVDVAEKPITATRMKLEMEDIDNQDEYESNPPTPTQRVSFTEELDRRLSHAALLYEEAITVLDDVLHASPQVKVSTPTPNPKKLPLAPTPTRVQRVPSLKSAFAKPDNEWI